MTPFEALQLLAMIAENALLTGAEHDQAREAVNVLAETLKPKPDTGPVAGDPNWWKQQDAVADAEA